MIWICYKFVTRILYQYNVYLNAYLHARYGKYILDVNISTALKAVKVFVQ